MLVANYFFSMSYFHFDQENYVKHFKAIQHSSYNSRKFITLKYYIVLSLHCASCHSWKLYIGKFETHKELHFKSNTCA